MRFFYLFIPFLIIQTTVSQTIKIDTLFSEINPLSELVYLPDLDNSFHASTIVKQSFITATKLNFSIKKGTYWFKLKIDNTTKESKKIFFDIREAIVSQVNVYKFESDSLKPVFSLKPSHVLENEHEFVQNLSIPITLAELEISEFYIKVLFPKTANFPLHIRTAENEAKIVRYSLLRQGLYYGFVLMVFIINFFFYLSLKENVFLYYLIFLTAITCGFLYYDGFFYEILQKGWLLYNIDSFIHFYITLAGALFITKFLQLPIYFKTINKIGLSFLIVVAILCISQIITDNFLFLALADALGFFILAVYWTLGVFIFKKNDYARFFVLGYSLMLFITPLFMLPLDFGLSGFGIKLESLKLGGMLEMLILTYAITYRTKVLQKEYNFVSSELHAFMDKYMALKKTAQSATNPDEDVVTKIENLKQNYALSDRETEVLLCISQHKTNKEIADYLYLSVNTIKFHTRNIYEKLDINTRAAVRNKLKETL
ncbi:MAG: LuxR C-terminal-related transcriptional regulator [Flavobacteriaceae bacterium]|nr:LuxR C-terminal-related transcriptional regulator [Flavobacteriaceae bacterium]